MNENIIIHNKLYTIRESRQSHHQN